MKGKTNNPYGAPEKTESLSWLMREYLRGVDGEEKVQRKEKIVRVVYARAMQGDDKAMKLIWNYLEGMPKQDQNINLEGKLSLVNILNAARENR